MSTATKPASLLNNRADVPHDLIWRLTVDQYHEMIRAGILTEDDPVELLEGWLVVKMPKKPPHSLSTQLARQALERVVPAGWFVMSQEPITTDDSEPEPDISVVRGDIRQYLDRHPGPQDVAFVAEVADATLERDRGWKKRLYAAARIPVYWVINLVDKQVEFYSDPGEPGDYRQRHVYGPSDGVPVIIEGREIGRIMVRDLLP